MNMRDYSTLHLETNSSKGTTLLFSTMRKTRTLRWV